MSYFNGESVIRSTYPFANMYPVISYQDGRYAVDTMQSVCLKEAGAVGPLAEETTLVGMTFGGYLRSKVVSVFVVLSRFTFFFLCRIDCPCTKTQPILLVIKIMVSFCDVMIGILR